jgi:hypothetical protein
VRAAWIVVAVAAVGLAGGAGANASPAAPGPVNLTLRLSDLAPGYLVGDDSGCGSGLVGEGVPADLENAMRQHRHRGCVSQFELLWAPPGAPAGPPLVESTAFRFAQQSGAEAAFAMAQSVVAHVIGARRGSLVPRPATVTIGDSLAMFETNDALVEGRARRPGVAVLWRTGRVLALLFTGGQAGPSAEQTALALAARQQARIVTPTPLGPRENDDREVPLDNPGLGIEVHWLGRHFRPAGPLPPLALTASYGPMTRFGGPGWRAELDYSARGRGIGVKLGLWRPSAFARFRRSRLGRLARTGRCATAERHDLRAGRAVIYGGYSDPPRRCRERPPDRYLAHVFLDRMVVTVNVPFCFCRDLNRPRGDPYDTRAGMRAVAEGLRLRPTP